MATCIAIWLDKKIILAHYQYSTWVVKRYNPDFIFYGGSNAYQYLENNKEVEKKYKLVDYTNHDDLVKLLGVKKIVKSRKNTLVDDFNEAINGVKPKPQSKGWLK